MMCQKVKYAREENKYQKWIEFKAKTKMFFLFTQNRL